MYSESPEGNTKRAQNTTRFKTHYYWLVVEFSMLKWSVRPWVRAF